MIYFCADDYGLCDISSMHIQHCIDSGALNKVSVFPNFDRVDVEKIMNNKDIRISLHLNLVEGRCMAEADKVDLLADSDGNFRHTFGGLLKLSLLCPKRLEEQLRIEIRAQVLYWKSILPEAVPFCIDSHQHTHMIPAVFRALLTVLDEEKIALKYIRIPSEPVSPFIKTPSLYFSYSPINIVKQWLLRFLWFINKPLAKQHGISASYFFGILFSGRMDAKRVEKILPKYIELTQKKGMDIEVLFHPGYITENEIDFENKNIVFQKFYLSENRKAEYDSAMKLSKGSVH